MYFKTRQINNLIYNKIMYVLIPKQILNEYLILVGILDLLNDYLMSCQFH